MISADTPSATSLPGSEGGLTHSDSRDGRMTDLFGQVHAPASHSPRQGDRKLKKTTATSGLYGSGSLQSAALQSSMGSKLKERLPMDGWMKSRMTWEERVTPSGRRYCQLAVSVRPTRETDCGLWLTPRANEFVEPSGQAAKRLGDRKETTACSLGEQVRDAALWATPNTMDHMAMRSQEAKERQFSTTRKGRTAPANLREQVKAEMYPSLWGTPSSRDWKDTPGMATEATNPDGSTRRRMDQLPRQIPNGFNAPTEKPAQLNPAFTCWLMGYPAEWLFHAPSEKATPKHKKCTGTTGKACSKD